MKNVCRVVNNPGWPQQLAQRSAISHERLTLPLYAELTPSCLYRGSAVRAKETYTTTDSINQVGSEREREKDNLPGKIPLLMVIKIYIRIYMYACMHDSHLPPYAK